MKPNRLLIIVPSFRSGGTVSSLINFVSLINKEKYHVSVFAITNYGPNKKYVAEHCTIVGEKTNHQGKSVKSIKGEFRTRMLDVAKSIKKLLEKANIDISPILFKRYAKKLDKGEYNYVLAFQEGQATLFGSYFKHGIKVAWVRSEYTRFIKGAGDKYNAVYENYDKIVSVSKAALSSFLSILPQYQDRAYVQYNFLNDNRILSLSNEKVDDLWDNSLFTIVTLGRIDPVKRVGEIPRICKELIDMGLKFRWIVMGGVSVDEEYKQLKKNVEKFHVQGVVVISGNKPNPYPYLKNCDLLVSLSKSETFNNTLTEAKILGVPVVTTDYPCAYESIDDGQEGLVVSFENIVPSVADMISNRSNVYSFIKERLSKYKYDKDNLLEQLYINVLN